MNLRDFSRPNRADVVWDMDSGVCYGVLRVVIDAKVRGIYPIDQAAQLGCRKNALQRDCDLTAEAIVAPSCAARCAGALPACAETRQKTLAPDRSATSSARRRPARVSGRPSSGVPAPCPWGESCHHRGRGRCQPRRSGKCPSALRHPCRASAHRTGSADGSAPPHPSRRAESRLCRGTSGVERSPGL
jgi:hypothetical protein